MYEWGGYSGTLLTYYKDADLPEYAKRLSEAIEKAEAKNIVPPGLYAEYGYAMLELDRPQDAQLYFAKEKERWPESAYLMDKLIIRLNSITSSDGANRDAVDNSAAKPSE
jgi:hypothetical protein